MKDSRYDLIIRGGRVVDPLRDVDEVCDVGIRGGAIAAVRAGLSREARSAKTVDAEGKVVTPGLIDLHVHLFDGATEFGIEADPYCIARGVTTAFDAGSSGAYTFDGMKKYVLDRCETRIGVFLNCSSHGMISRAPGELIDSRFADVNRAVAICRCGGKDIAGVKIRLSRGIVQNNAEEVLGRAVRISEETGLPLMVHPNKSSLSLREILGTMRAGDILTHCYHRSGTGIVDANARIRREVLEARSRGILFDVGHGMGSFSFEVAEAALAGGFEPDTISTDLHRFNIRGPVFDLPTTLSKFLALGMTLPRVVEKATVAPARVMGLIDRIGSLAPGSRADVAVFDLQDEACAFADTEGGERSGSRKLVPAVVVKDGAVYSP